MNNNLDEIKIGARILSQNGLDVLLPNNEDIFSKIENIRSLAKEYRENKNKSNEIINNDKEYDRQFNNSISILGGRGSGKTSALLTIKYKLSEEDKYRNDIVTQILVPEKMGDSSDVLGWTIGVFGDIVDTIEKKIYESNKKEFLKDSDFFKDCRRREQSKLKEIYYELLEYYTYTNKDYKKILLNNYENLNNYVKKSKKILSAEQELSIKFDGLISKIIEVKKKINGNEEEPLIYIFFDDVDLSTQSPMQLINIILKYLSNANIVTFISADYDDLLESITIELLRKEDLLDEDKRNNSYYLNGSKKNQSAIYSKQILSYDILKKVMPPTLRHYIPKLSNTNKMKFKYDKSDSKNKYPEIYDLIVKKLIHKDNREDKFINYKSGVLDIYFSIFDDVSRGLMNVYYQLYTLEDADNDSILVKNIRKFIKVLVDSSITLSKYEDDINKIIYIEENISKSIINYNYINSSLAVILDRYRINNNKLNDEKIKLFIFVNFIDSIIAVRYRGIELNKGNIIVKILNDDTEFKIYPSIKNERLLLKIYSEINTKISKEALQNRNNIEDGYTNKDTLLIYFNILDNIEGYENIVSLLEEVYEEDSEWVYKVIDKIIENCRTDEFIVYNNILEVGNYFDKYIKKNLKDIRDTIIDITRNNINILHNLIDDANLTIEHINNLKIMPDDIHLINKDNIYAQYEIKKTENIIKFAENYKRIIKETSDSDRKIRFTNENEIIKLETLFKSLDNDELKKIIDRGNIRYKFIKYYGSNWKFEDFTKSIKNNIIDLSEYNTIIKALIELSKELKNLNSKDEDISLLNQCEILDNIDVVLKKIYTTFREKEEVLLIEIYRLLIISKSILEIINEGWKYDEYSSLLSKIEDNKNEEWFKAMVKNRREFIIESNMTLIEIEYKSNNEFGIYNDVLQNNTYNQYMKYNISEMDID